MVRAKQMTPLLLLASRSPRRRDLLRQVGIRFRGLQVEISEQRRAGESPLGMARRLAREKARSGADRRPGNWVLGCDTVVVHRGRPIGKPRSRAEAGRVLRRLSDATHQVITAIALVDPTGQMHQRFARTRVRFARLTKREIERYLDSTEPWDKAGAYALQGAAGWFVASIEGSVSNVIGLPLETLRALLYQLGWTAPQLGAKR